MAVLGSSDNSVKVRIDTSANTKGVDDTSKSLERLEGSSSLGGKGVALLGAAAKAGAVGLAALSAAGTLAGKSAISSAADFEQTRIGLENMLGSADAARAMLKQISQFAANTPFEFPELANATRQLVAFGFSGEDAFKTMKQLGDVSAAIGAPIGDLSYLMGTLRAQGRAFTIDIRQFAQRGIPIYEYLAKVLKTDTKALDGLIESGKVGFPEVQKAFEMMTAEGGKFHGTMQKQSKSLSGLFSTLKDNIGLAGRELVGISQEGDIKAGSIFEKLTFGVTKLNDRLGTINWSNVSSQALDMATKTGRSFQEMGGQVFEAAKKIETYLEPKFKAVYNTIKNDFAPAVFGLAKALGPAAGTGLVAILGLAVDSLNLLLKVATPVLNFLRDNTWIIWGLVAAFGALKAALAIQAAAAGFQAAMALVVGTSAGATGVLTGTAAAAGGLRGALILLATNWQITLGVLGAAAAVETIRWVGNELDKLMNKWANAGKKINVGGNVNVDSSSGTGLVAQLRNAFGGFRATGGPVQANKAYVVGDNPDGSLNKTSELFIPKQSGTILSSDQTRSMLSSSSQGSSVSNTRTVTIQQVILSTDAAVKAFFKEIDNDTNLSSIGFATNRGAI